MSNRITQVLGLVITFIGISIFSLGGTAGVMGTGEDNLFFFRAAAYVTGPVIAFIGVYLLIKDRRKTSFDSQQE
ncbi:MAG: hypothetical protein ACXAEU_02915 [Candidatus Hodarchaeales archaeon]|jgi:hypothetical protein